MLSITLTSIISTGAIRNARERAEESGYEPLLGGISLFDEPVDEPKHNFERIAHIDGNGEADVFCYIFGVVACISGVGLMAAGLFGLFYGIVKGILECLPG